MSATPGPLSTPSSSQRVSWNGVIGAEHRVHVAGEQQLHRRRRAAPSDAGGGRARSATVRPAASTASTGAGSSSAKHRRASAAKASASRSAMRSSPARLREPLLTAAQAKHLVEHRLRAARARRPARSVDDSSPMARLLAAPHGERHPARCDGDDLGLQPSASARRSKPPLDRFADQRLLAAADVEPQRAVVAR